MGFLCEHGKLIWLVSIVLCMIIWNMIYLKRTRGSFFFRFEYPALIAYIVVSFIVLIFASDQLCQ